VIETVALVADALGDGVADGDGTDWAAFIGTSAAITNDEKKVANDLRIFLRSSQWVSS